MRGLRNFVLFCVLVALCIAGYFWWKKTSEKTPNFILAHIRRGSVTQSVSASGTVEPRDVIDVGAQVAGLIDSFGMDADDHRIDYDSPVNKGTILAHIDDRVYVSDVAAVAAQVAQAKANVQLAEATLQSDRAKLVDTKRDWDRAKKIGISDALAATQYDSYEALYNEALANMAVGRATVAQAQAVVVQDQTALARAKINLAYCTIVSPVKGIVIDRRVNIGQTVVASLSAPSLFLIAKDLKRIQVWASVNEADIGQIAPGQRVTFRVDARPNHIFHGVVGKVRLNATMQQNVVTYTVVVNTTNNRGLLLPYLTAALKFQVAKRNNVILAPDAALRWTPALAYIAPKYRSGLKPSGGSSGVAMGGTTPARRRGTVVQKGIVWTPDGKYLRPVQVRVGLSNGMVAQVTGAGVKPGMAVVVGQSITAAKVLRNPFLPHGHRK